MKNIFTLLFIFTVSILYAQEKIYLDGTYQEVTDPSKAVFYKIEKEVNFGEIDLHRRTYRMNDSISAEQFYSTKNGKEIKWGKHKFWYNTGEPWYEIEYRNDERYGELIAWWKNGAKRRHDFFKRGKLKSGTVWNEQGQEVEHFPYWIPASFPGGNEAMQAYLKENLPIPGNQKIGTTVKVALLFNINEEGIIDEIKIIDGAPRWYNAVAVQVLSNMPRWNPARYFGEPLPSSYSLPISFVK